jgi:hypothetical protein
MTVLRTYFTAGCVLFGAAIGAGIVTVPLTATPSGDTVQVGVSAAREALPAPRLGLIPPPAVPDAPAPPAPAAAPAAPMGPAVVANTAPTPDPVPVKWAFTPNTVKRSGLQGPGVPDSDVTRASATYTPTGSGGVSSTPKSDPAPPDGNVRDLMTTAVRLAEGSEKVLRSLLSGGPGD